MKMPVRFVQVFLIQFDDELFYKFRRMKCGSHVKMPDFR